MELRHLRYFVGVAQYLNYSEASRRLHVAQPAISQTILDLEEELSVKLLLRTKRAVQLTAAGTAFLREAQEILRRANEAQHLAQRAARGEVGTLGIGFFGAASAPILPALVQAYRRAFPDVELRLFEMNPDQQLAAFDEGRIHLGFTQLMLQAQQRAQHVSVEGGRVILRGLLHYRSGLAFRTRSVDGHVQAAKPLDGLINQTAHIVFEAHVGAEVFSLHAERTQFGG